jgi:hypothetical protein
MENLTKYILFVFAKNDKPKEFTEQIADELTVVSDVPNVNFYYGPESSVFTFSTLETFEDVKEYIEIILGVETITYILLPYTPDKMSYGLPDKVSKHLFNDGISDYMSENPKNSPPTDFEVQNMLRNHIQNRFFLDLSDFDEENDDDEIALIRQKKQKLTFDDVFNKLAESGIKSLNKDELLILKQYSQ